MKPLRSPRRRLRTSVKRHLFWTGRWMQRRSNQEEEGEKTKINIISYQKKFLQKKRREKQFLSCTHSILLRLIHLKLIIINKFYFHVKYLSSYFCRIGALPSSTTYGIVAPAFVVPWLCRPSRVTFYSSVERAHTHKKIQNRAAAAAQKKYA